VTSRLILLGRRRRRRCFAIYVTAPHPAAPAAAAALGLADDVD